MMARPLISTEIGSGTSHVNVDGQTGIVVPPNCPESLRAALSRLWEDQELASRLGDGARERFENLFNGALMADRYRQTYEDVVEPHGSKSDTIDGERRDGP